MKFQNDRTPKSATLDDVAAHAGVSRMAVSVVMNGSRSGTRVSQLKREQIMSAARELNYRPNLVARSLARRSTHVFGFYSGFDYLDVRNPFIAEIAAGLLEQCSRCRRDLLLHTLFHGQDINGLFNEVTSGKIDGLVIWAPEDNPLVARLRQGNLPVVSIVESVPSFPSVRVDDHAGAFEMGRYLFSRGHRSLLYVTQKRPSPSRGQRQEAMLEVGQQLGMEVRVVVEPNAQDFVTALHEHHPSQKRPTAVACWNDMAALQVLAFCRQAGISVPRDLAITGFDGIRSPNPVDLTLTTVGAPWEQVASAAIDRLIDLSEGQEVSQETVLPVQLILGDTA